MKFRVGDKVRLKEHVRDMSYDDRREHIEEEVDGEIAEWWANNPDGIATVSALMDDDLDFTEAYFAVDDDQESFDECWLSADDFELVNQVSKTLEEVEEI